MCDSLLRLLFPCVSFDATLFRPFLFCLFLFLLCPCAFSSRNGLFIFLRILLEIGLQFFLVRVAIFFLFDTDFLWMFLRIRALFFSKFCAAGGFVGIAAGLDLIRVLFGISDMIGEDLLSILFIVLLLGLLYGFSMISIICRIISFFIMFVLIGMICIQTERMIFVANNVIIFSFT